MHPDKQNQKKQRQLSECLPIVSMPDPACITQTTVEGNISEAICKKLWENIPIK